VALCVRQEGARIDLWASGAAIAAMSVAAIIAFSDWEEWTKLLIGFWLMVSPWMLGFAHTGAMHVGIWVGGSYILSPAMVPPPSFSGRMPPAIKFYREFN
jgi:SPW repeat